jgi:hypothetical protein
MWAVAVAWGDNKFDFMIVFWRVVAPSLSRGIKPGLQIPGKSSLVTAIVVWERGKIIESKLITP